MAGRVRWLFPRLWCAPSHSLRRRNQKAAFAGKEAWWSVEPSLWFEEAPDWSGGCLMMVPQWLNTRQTPGSQDTSGTQHFALLWGPSLPGFAESEYQRAYGVREVCRQNRGCGYPMAFVKIINGQILGDVLVQTRSGITVLSSAFWMKHKSG